MSLRDLLKETATHQDKMHAELRQRLAEAEARGFLYEDYDEYKADAYEDAVDRLDILLEAFAKEEENMKINPYRFRFETNPYGRRGWFLTVQPFRRGAGYRAYDFPWHTQNINDPWWTTRAWFSHIPGITLRVGWKPKRAKSWGQQANNFLPTPGQVTWPLFWMQLAINGNRKHSLYPGWW